MTIFNKLQGARYGCGEYGRSFQKFDASFDKPQTITRKTDQTVQFAHDGERARYRRYRKVLRGAAVAKTSRC